MSRFDRLPPELRGWLREAALPWSLPSAERLWARLAREHAGDTQAMRDAMSRAEARTLGKDRIA